MTRLLLVVAILLSGSAWATDDVHVKIGVSEQPPFVIDSNTGYAVEVWEHIADDLNLVGQLVTAMDVTDKLSMVEGGEVRVGIGGISLTGKREHVVDFTHPIYNAGLGLMYIDHEEHMLVSIFKSVDTIMFWFLALMVLAGHLIWFVERGNAFTSSYFKGVFEGMYWAVVTASTVGYGDKAPLTALGRALAGFLIVISLPMFGLFTASLLEVVGNNQPVAVVPGEIQGSIGVISNTTGEWYASEYHFKTKKYGEIGAAIQGLRNKDVKAIIYDAPTLQWFAKTTPTLQVSPVTFESQYLAFVVGEDDDALKENINQSIVGMMEAGELQRLQIKWFGAAQ